MRKFNLKGTVIQRMKGIPREEPNTVTEEKNSTCEITPVPSFAPEQGQFACACRTDVGRLRKNNQDALIIGNGMVGVADGMGGHNGGEIASAGLRDGLLRETKDCCPEPGILEKAVKKVNRELWNQQENDESLQGMGTTLTVIWPSGHDMIIGQIGDSRAYLLRNGELNQITDDHSMVADMVRKGVLTEEQAACHPMRNYITRAVGTEEEVDIDLSIQHRQKGDRWLVCSDGLYGMISRSAIQQIMETGEPEEIAEKLLQAALAGGGKDNISLIVLRDDTDFCDADDSHAEKPDETIDNSSQAAEVTET